MPDKIPGWDSLPLELRQNILTTVLIDQYNSGDEHEISIAAFAHWMGDGDLNDTPLIHSLLALSSVSKRVRVDMKYAIELCMKTAKEEEHTLSERFVLAAPFEFPGLFMATDDLAWDYADAGTRLEYVKDMVRIMDQRQR